MSPAEELVATILGVISLLLPFALWGLLARARRAADQSPPAAQARPVQPVAPTPAGEEAWLRRIKGSAGTDAAASEGPVPPKRQGLTARPVAEAGREAPFRGSEPLAALGRLPPLQRAVVMSELLAPALALRGPREADFD